MTTPKHILIVDDEPRMRRFVRMNLELEVRCTFAVISLLLALPRGEK